jgi:hypothetical protein
LHKQILRLDPEPVGGGAVVIMQDADDWRCRPIICRRYAGVQGTQSVYPTEVRMVMVAGEITNQVNVRTKVYTDCMSVVSATNKPRITHLTKDNAMGVHLGMITMMRNSMLDLHHVKAHADAKMASEWTRSQWGNFIADNVAAGRYNHPLMPRNIVVEECSMYDAEDWFRKSNRIYLVGKDGLALSQPINTLVSKNRINKYFSERAAVSQNVDRTRWVEPTIKLATRAASSLSYQYMQLRLRYDKSYHGGNERRDGGEGLCPLCGEEDSLSHIAAHCQNRESAAIRKVCNRKILKLKAKMPPDEMTFITALSSSAVSKPDQGWTGVLSKDTVAELGILATRFTPDQVKKMKTAAVAVIKMRQEALGNMWRARARQVREEAVVVGRRRTLPVSGDNGIALGDYFPRDGVG